MKKSIVILFFMLCVSFATAQQTQKQENIKELVSISMGETLNDMMSNMSDFMFSQTKFANKLEAEKKIVKDIVTSESISLLNKLKVDIEEIYDKHFSEKEVVEYLAFMKSDTGKSMLKNTPIIQKEMYDIIKNKHMAIFSENIQKRLEKELPKKEAILQESSTKSNKKEKK